MKCALPFFAVFTLLNWLAIDSSLGMANTGDAVPDAISFADSTSSLQIQPVTALDSFVGFTLEPQRITIKVRELGSDSLVGEAPVSFELTSISGSLSGSLDFDASTVLHVTTDLTGTATVFFHPRSLLEISGEVRATVDRGDASVTFVFHQDFLGLLESPAGLEAQMNATGNYSTASPTSSVGSIIETPTSFAALDSLSSALAGSVNSVTEAATAIGRYRAAIEAFRNRTLIVFTPLE